MQLADYISFGVCVSNAVVKSCKVSVVLSILALVSVLLYHNKAKLQETSEILQKEESMIKICNCFRSH